MNIQGTHIFLRPLEAGDAKDIYECLNDPDMVRWTTRIPYPYTLAHAKEFIVRTQQKNTQGKSHTFAIIAQDTRRLIGIVNFFKLRNIDKRAELGYWIAKSYWGKGFMSEAVNLALGIAFDTLLFHRVEANCFAQNIASCRVLEKCGFTHEGTMRQKRFRAGEWHDVDNYSILVSEYKNNS